MLLAMVRHVVALGGGGFSMEPDNPLLDDYVLGLTGKDRPRVCFVPTAGGDSADYLERFYRAFDGTRCQATHLALFKREVDDLERFVLEQDLVYVGGGNTLNLLAVWRAHRLDRVMRQAWEAGVVLCGVSAGALCWFEDGVTDSLGTKLSALGDGLGLVAGSFCPHFDGESDRRPIYHALVQGGMRAGVAADDGAAVHYADGRCDAVSSRPLARAYRVERGEQRVVEIPLPTRYLGA